MHVRQQPCLVPQLTLVRIKWEKLPIKLPAQGADHVCYAPDSTLLPFAKCRQSLCRAMHAVISAPARLKTEGSPVIAWLSPASQNLLISPAQCAQLCQLRQAACIVKHLQDLFCKCWAECVDMDVALRALVKMLFKSICCGKVLMSNSKFLQPNIWVQVFEHP